MPLINTTVDVTAGQTSTGDTVITPGGFIVFSGGAISETAAVDGGFTVIVSGGTATATTLQGGGIQEVDGEGVVTTVVDTLIASAGLEFVFSSGVTSGATVLKGGREELFVSGSAVGMTVNGGSAVISSGGTASGSDVINGGVVTVFSGGSDKAATVGPGGTLNVSSGGTDSGTSVTGGTMNVSSGATASGTSVTGGTFNVSSGGTADAASVSSGGTMNVSSGGTASGVSVGSGGTLNVSAGGVVSALTIKDPNDPGVTAAVNVLSGGTVDGATKINGGQLILDAGAVFQPHAALTMINNSWLVLEQNSFKGTIKDFGGQDFMDLTKIRFIGQTTETFTKRPPSRRRRDPLNQPSLGRHLHDRELRARERWSARHAGDFCPQCLAAGARLGDIIRRSCCGAEAVTGPERTSGNCCRRSAFMDGGKRACDRRFPSAAPPAAQCSEIPSSVGAEKAS